MVLARLDGAADQEGRPVGHEARTVPPEGRLDPEMADRERRPAESLGGEMRERLRAGVGGVDDECRRVPADRPHPQAMAFGIAGPAVFGMGDRDQVVDEEHRPHVGAGVEPVEPLGLVEAQVRGVEIQAAFGERRDRCGAQDPEHGLGLDAPSAEGARARAGPSGRDLRRAAGEASLQAAIDRVVVRRHVLGPARGDRIDDPGRLSPVEHPRPEAGRDQAEPRARAVEHEAGIGEVDPVDPRRARMAQPRDEAGEVEGDRPCRHDAPAGRHARPCRVLAGPRAESQPGCGLGPRGGRAGCGRSACQAEGGAADTW